MTMLSGPRLANHDSALANDSGVTKRLDQGEFAARRPKLDPSQYRPMSPTQMPRNALASPSLTSRRPAVARLAASNVAPSS